MTEEKNDKKIPLTPSIVNLGKKGTTAKCRTGFVDERGQVFLPPANVKRLESWKKKMADKGYEVQW